MTDEKPNMGIPFREAFVFWLKLGFISFGGPAGQIAIMHQELVEKKRWISERRFIHALNYCMMLPGPEAQQLATYIGWLMHRTRGGLVAGGLFVLPSLFILIALSWVYVTFGDVSFVAGIFYGIKSAVTAIVVQATWRIGARTLKNPLLWAVATGAFIGIFALKLPFPLIILLAAVVGGIGGRLKPEYFSLGDLHKAGSSKHLPAVIDDDTPVPPHARLHLSRIIGIFGVGVAMWGASLGLMMAIWGVQSPFTQMGWFFTKAALLTFGGAYAVLPYVYQGGVEQYGWLNATQMIDGLALGETTPGPLIMVVSFVGFMGGYNTAPLGSDSMVLAGILAACFVTWFTFLPSFMFIFVGAPVIESTHGNIRFTAPLTGITAAVVGVILNLALFFAYHTLWPDGFAGALDWIMLAMTGCSLALLFYLKRNVLEVIGIMGALGMFLTLLGWGAAN